MLIAIIWSNYKMYYEQKKKNVCNIVNAIDAKPKTKGKKKNNQKRN